MSAIPGKTRRWTEEELALLGTMPDRTLAKLIGCAHATVGRKRREYGRAKSPWKPSAKTIPSGDTAALVRLLVRCGGNISEVARRLEVNVAVAWRRYKRAGLI